jgi:hypothetical protein
LIAEAIAKILGLAPPNIQKFGDLSYSDKKIDLIQPPIPSALDVSDLEALSDLCEAKFDGLEVDDVLFHIETPERVELFAKEADSYGRIRQYAVAVHNAVEPFKFGQWYGPEAFAIQAQIGFQRVKVENDDGSFAKDLDYVLDIASKITAERAVENADDGIAQRVALRQGVQLKGEDKLRGRVNLAPFRTFTEVDQPLSEFLFRARYTDNGVQLALFEADGGRWKTAAKKAIKEWLQDTIADAVVIS